MNKCCHYLGVEKGVSQLGFTFSLFSIEIFLMVACSNNGDAVVVVVVLLAVVW